MKLRWTAAVAGGMVLSVLLATTVLADNCGSLSDCYRTAQAAIAASVGLTMLAIGLSIFLDFVPVVGEVKGVIQAITGRDLITGQELSTWERAIGLLPVGGALLTVGILASKEARAVSQLARLNSEELRLAGYSAEAVAEWAKAGAHLRTEVMSLSQYSRATERALDTALWGGRSGYRSGQSADGAGRGSGGEGCSQGVGSGHRTPHNQAWHTVSRSAFDNVAED